MYLSKDQTMVVRASELIGNIARGGESSSGGAITALTDTDVTIDDSLFRGNKAANGTRDSRGTLRSWLHILCSI